MWKLDTSFMDQLKNEPGYKKWKPIVAFLVMLAFYFIFGLLALGIQATFQAATGTLDPASFGMGGNPANYIDIDFTNPFDIFFNMLQVIVIIPAVALGMKFTKLGGLKTLKSNERKLRLNRIVSFVPLLIVLYAAETVVSALIGAATGNPLGAFRFPVAALIVVLLFIPFQAAAEEFLCRGFLLQTIKSWIPCAWAAVIGQALLFALMHGYNPLGNLEILISGLFFGLAAVKTGGLEAPIAMHMINNLAAGFTTCLFVGNDVKKDMDARTFITGVVVDVLAYLIILYVSKKKGYLAEEK